MIHNYYFCSLCINTTLKIRLTLTKEDRRLICDPLLSALQRFFKIRLFRIIFSQYILLLSEPPHTGLLRLPHL